MKTIHIILNAHIDPVWLWPWPAGLDEVLNTCESVCDFLDRHPDLFFTRGESWVYEQIERTDPRLFGRIRRHVRAGRWEIVGGWYVQPDCNLPGRAGFEKQIDLGRKYFREKFGLFPNIAYNVDSFGHASILPELMAAAGQKYYVMLRPGPSEMTLPARVFRWRTRPGAPEIVTFRIAGGYNTGRAPGVPHFEKSLTDLPRGLDHTACFIGVGDHGGGPNEEMFQWCIEHRDAIPGARLEFSSLSRFFQAVSRSRARIPVVTGELQHHAIGCYSVHRPVKVRAHRAEHILVQAGNAVRLLVGAEAAASRQKLEDAWRWVCFNQFHDTMGGTCIPSAYEIADAQLGGAQTIADDVLQHALRRYVRKLAPSPHQRLVIANFSDSPFDSWIEHEPWLPGVKWTPETDWRLVDEQGAVVPHQLMDVEAVAWIRPRLLFKLGIEKRGFRVLRIVRRAGKRKSPPAVPLTVRCARGKLALAIGRRSFPVPRLELIDDPTDTWSHGISSYEGRRAGTVMWGSPREADSGPLLRAWRVDGAAGRSYVTAEWRRYAQSDFIELHLKVTWLETQRLLRLAWEPGSDILWREDGVPGGGLRRESDGNERPVRERTLLRLKNGEKAGVVMPEVFSLSSSPRELRLTLLRSAVMAHHEPNNGVRDRRVISDQGVHEFLFRFFPVCRSGVELDHHADALCRRPVVAETTRGMPLCIGGRTEPQPG